MARGARFVLPLSLFLVALLARLAAFGRYVTPDELNWVYRSLGLRRALLTANWPQTIQSGHPGVITTWIGALSAQIQLWLQPELHARLAWLERLQQLSADNVEAFRHLYAFLDGGRLGVALVVSLGLVLIFLLARALLGSSAAFLGALLMALDPFFAGLSGLLHVDALLAIFTLLALLLALLAQRAASNTQGWALAATAGVCTAMAILTKTPGLILLAFVPLILLWPVFQGLPPRFGIQAPKGEEAAESHVMQVVIWAAALALTALLLLPALWAAPRQVVEIVSGLSGRLLEDAVRPTFFLGQTALDHGPRFYPLVLIFRLSPVALIGLALSLLVVVRMVSGRDVESARWLLLFALAFLLAISLVAKKFDRYALPSLVILTFVAGWGLTQMALHLGWDRRRVWAAAVLLQLAFLVSAWPHPLTAYNWLAGGNAVARKVFASGWGEDAGQAARALRASLDQPKQARLFTSSLTGTAPFFPGEVIRLRLPNLTRLKSQDYLLSLPQDRQLALQTLQPQSLPVEAVTEQWSVKGVGTATLRTGLAAADLQLPSFALQPRDLRSGATLQLVAAGSVFLPWPQETIVGLTWQRAGGDVLPSYRLQLDLLNRDGQVWLQREMPLLNQYDHTPADWPAGVPQTVFHAVRLPATLPPDNYDWHIRLFDDQGGQQALFTSSGAFAGTQIPVAEIAVTPPQSQPAPNIPLPIDGAGPMAGYAGLPQTATAGGPFTLELWWRAQDPSIHVLVLEIGGRRLPLALDTAGWRTGQIYHIRPTWRLPHDLSPGNATVSLIVQDPGEQVTIAGPLPLGQLRIDARQRSYALPTGVDALQLQLGDLALLQDVDLELQEETVLVHVIWQAQETTFTNYTAFVHLRDGEQVIAGDDRQTSPPTSRWVEGEVIQETYTLPRPRTGMYSVAIGLYNSTGGARLPLRHASGQPLENDQYVLPLEVP